MRISPRLLFGAAAIALAAGCAAPTPNEVRAVPPVFSVSAKPKTPAFCECLLREADERVMIGLFPTPIAKRLIPAGDGCEVIVGDTVPYAIVRATKDGAEVRLMRDITRAKEHYLTDHWFDVIAGQLRDSIKVCFSND